MKKLLAVILVMIMLVSFTGCGRLWLLLGIAETLTTPGIVGSDADEEQELLPYMNLPEYSEDFKEILGYIDIDEERIEKFMGYCKAAHDKYDAKQFCKYMVYKADTEIFNVLSDAMKEEADKTVNDSSEEAFRRTFALQEMNFDLITIKAGLSAYDLAYFDIDESGDASAYEDLKESYVYFINQFAKLVYDKEII